MRVLLTPFVALSLSAGGLIACAPSPQAPVQVMAVVPGEDGNYGVNAVELTTVTSVTGLSGTAADFVGGNVVVVDPNDQLLQSVGGRIETLSSEVRYNVLVKNKGSPVRANYIEQVGRLWPVDFHSWNMASSYYNFEQAYLYFLGILPTSGSTPSGPAELQRVRVMYWPEVRINSSQPLSDNALYLSFIESFVVVPAKTLQQVPLAMNLGVIGHEVAHRVYSARVYEGAALPAPLMTWTLAPFNLLKSLDEGLADFHGYGVTCRSAGSCQPSFLSPSVDDARTLAMRDVSNANACMDESLRTAFRGFMPDAWIQSEEMYRLGNVFAATFYQAGQRSGSVAAMQKALVESYDSASPTGLRQLVNGNLNNPAAVTPEAVVNVFAAHMSDPTLKRSFCNEAVDRLQLPCTEFPCTALPACPPEASRGTTGCKLLETP